VTSPPYYKTAMLTHIDGFTGLMKFSTKENRERQTV